MPIASQFNLLLFSTTSSCLLSPYLLFSTRMSSSSASAPSSALVASPPKAKATKSRKSVKDSTKDKASKAQKSTTNKPKVETKRKLAVDTSSSKTTLLTPPLKTKLTKLDPAKQKKPFVPFIQHEAKELDVHFLGALLGRNDQDKVSLQVDDDAAAYLKELCNRFSMDVDFKVPIRSGTKKNAGKYYVNASVAVNDDGSDAIDADLIESLARDIVEVKGKLRTYNFNTEENGEVKNLKGCSLKLDYMAHPAQSPTGTSGEDDTEEGADHSDSE